MVLIKFQGSVLILTGNMRKVRKKINMCSSNLDFGQVKVEEYETNNNIHAVACVEVDDDSCNFPESQIVFCY